MSSQFSPEVVSGICSQLGLAVIERRDIDGRSVKHKPIPAGLHSKLRQKLTKLFPDGLYSHQSSSLEALLKGKDVCLATSTASGKSLVFSTFAAHLALTGTNARTLCLYPARALIQDQLAKWHGILNDLHLRHGHIDGGVNIALRPEILRSSQVVLMTPDVAHAWLMSNLKSPEVSNFLRDVKLLVLDEAHVYDGVFGTNMAFFLRRFRVAAGPHQIVSCTATLGRPEEFVRQLTGREPKIFGPQDDGSGSPPKTLLLAAPSTAQKAFDLTVKLLRELAHHHSGRLLAFGDSRKVVELIVAASQREEAAAEVEDEADDEPDRPTTIHRLLPYRAGYEVEDRKAIQDALASGALRGVVATSAMELGLDIGELDLIVLLDVPPSIKSFWQRVGRAGRRRRGTCLVLDPRRTISQSAEAFDQYLARPPEPSWLYLENRYVQYTNALCAGAELRQMDHEPDLAPFDSAPESFRRFLENELNPGEAVEADLYPLKQRAQGGAPQHEFPIRSGIEQDFRVIGPVNRPLGSLSFSQALREGYPGGVYYYMACPYRVYQFNFRLGEIRAKREKKITTHPISQVMVFPRFDGGILSLRQGTNGFVSEVNLQVSERVVGFAERRGASKTEYRYGPTSPYSQRDLNRFFETTGVCWFVSEKRGVSDRAARVLMEHFCMVYSVQERDLGLGMFHSRRSPIDGQVCQGMCIFDATSGSLRLTQRLAENFESTVSSAIEWAAAQPEQEGLAELQALGAAIVDFEPSNMPSILGAVQPAEGEWTSVVAPGSKAMYLDGPPREVVVKGYRYTPKGLMYDLEHPDETTKWSVMAELVHPIFGETQRIQVNFITGETRGEEPGAG